MSDVTFKGTPLTVGGTFPKPGDRVPGFSLVGADLGDVTLESFGSTWPQMTSSLSTPTTATCCGTRTAICRQTSRTCCAR